MEPVRKHEKNESCQYQVCNTSKSLFYFLYQHKSWSIHKGIVEFNSIFSDRCNYVANSFPLKSNLQLENLFQIHKLDLA